MTSAQIKLLQAMVKADRDYRNAVKKGDYTYEPDWRGVELSPTITGFHRRTGEALVAAGLGEIMDLHASRQPHIFLGKYEPYD